MAAGLFKPYLAYDNGFSEFRPDVAREDWQEEKPTEKKDHVSAGDTLTRYVIGDRHFISLRFQNQTTAQLTSWDSFRTAVSDGSSFVYHDDDSYHKFGAVGLNFGSFNIGELQTNGATDNKLNVKLLNDATAAQEEVDGLWSIPLEMKVVT